MRNFISLLDSEKIKMYKFMDDTAAAADGWHAVVIPHMTLWVRWAKLEAKWG